MRYRNLITALMKKHTSRKLLSFQSSIYKEKCGAIFLKMKEL